MWDSKLIATRALRICAVAGCTEMPVSLRLVRGLGPYPTNFDEPFAFRLRYWTTMLPLIWVRTLLHFRWPCLGKHHRCQFAVWRHLTLILTRFQGIGCFLWVLCEQCYSYFLYILNSQILLNLQGGHVLDYFSRTWKRYKLFLTTMKHARRHKSK